MLTKNGLITILKQSQVILLIVSLLLYLLSATYLLKPFYQDNEPTKEQLIQSAVNTRRVQIPGTFMLFWSIGILILLKLENSNAVYDMQWLPSVLQ
jgi:hypothetical protein